MNVRRDFDFVYIKHNEEEQQERSDLLSQFTSSMLNEKYHDYYNNNNGCRIDRGFRRQQLERQVKEIYNYHYPQWFENHLPRPPSRSQLLQYQHLQSEMTSQLLEQQQLQSQLERHNVRMNELDQSVEQRHQPQLETHNVPMNQLDHLVSVNQQQPSSQQQSSSINTSHIELGQATKTNFLDRCSPYFQLYIKSFDNAETNVSNSNQNQQNRFLNGRIEALRVQGEQEEKLMQPFECSVSFSYMAIPVLLNERWYDWQTVQQLNFMDPFTKLAFHPRDLQAGRCKFDEFECVKKTIETMRAVVSTALKKSESNSN